MIESESTDPTVRKGDLVRKLAGDFSCPGFYLGGRIPEKKLRGAIGSYASQVDPQTVLLLQDNTVFGSAKIGFLFTNKSIYWRNLFEEPSTIHFGGVEQVSVTETTTVLEPARIEVNGESFEIDAPITIEKCNRLASILVEIIKLLK